MPESRRAAAIGCALMILLAAPPRANASTVGTGPDEESGSAIAISAAPGETNHVGVSYDAGTTRFTVTDTAGATAQSGCDQVDATTVTCVAGVTPATQVNRVVADLGDGDDTFAVGDTSLLYGTRVYGGGGNDTITTGNRPDVVLGEAGDDTISGGGGDDWLLGFEGNDSLNGGAGDDELDGGDGSDTVDAGPGDDLVNLREQTDGLSGTADPAATCGSDEDRIAVDTTDAAPAADCERRAPLFAAAPLLVVPAAVAGRTLTVNLAGAGITGLPAPSVSYVWQSCSDDDGCIEIAGDQDHYTLQPADVGHVVGAGVFATNGDVASLGFYAQDVVFTDLTGPVAPAPPDTDPGPGPDPDPGPSGTGSGPGAGPVVVIPTPLAPPPPPPPPPPAIAPAGTATATPVAPMRAALARKAMGAAVTTLRVGAGVTLYRRSGSRTVVVRGARPAYVVAAVCSAPACRVTVRSQLRLTTRRGGRTRTRRLVLPAIRRSLHDNAATAFGIKLTAAQRRLVRGARSATLRVSYEAAAGARTTRGNETMPVRVR